MSIQQIEQYLFRFARPRTETIRVPAGRLEVYTERLKRRGCEIINLYLDADGTWILSFRKKR